MKIKSALLGDERRSFSARISNGQRRFGQFVRAEHFGSGARHPGLCPARIWRGGCVGVSRRPRTDHRRDASLGVATLDQSQTATALAAALLGRVGVRRLRCRALSHGGHRIRCATGNDPGGDVCVPVFRHRQQSVSAGIFAGHQLHADFSGDGDFRLRGLSILHNLAARLEL